MDEIKVSVIVPVYNVKKYLPQCLDSIVNQTLKEIEIICVNDGSTDGSDKVLEEYAQKDSRIKIINNKDRGISKARNLGMANAKGRYIGFVDADDYIAPTMYEWMFGNADWYKSQMVICAVHKIDDSTGIVFDDDPYYTLGYFPYELNNRTFNHYETKNFLPEICVNIWNKLYLRSYLEEKQAKFAEGYVFEDGLFFTDIYFDMERVSVVRDFLYYYRVNRADSVACKGDKNLKDIFYTTEKTLENLKKQPYFDEIKTEFLRKKFKEMRNNYKSIQKQYEKEYYDEWRKFLRKTDDILSKEVFEEKYPYTYRNIKLIRDNSYFAYKKECLVEKCKHKIMKILYMNNDAYTFKFKEKYFCIKKNPNILNIWYENNLMNIEIKWLKIKFAVPFKYSELEDREESVK